MKLEDKLRQIFDRAEKVSHAALQKQTRTLASLIANVLRDATWGNVAARTDKALSDAVAQAQEWARILDATGYLEDKVFQPENARIVDVRLKQDLQAVQGQIQEMFDTKEFPRRGFVYIAWSAKPEEYWYVGKANSVERLNLTFHGKLARATAHATKLSLVFPSQSREEVLTGVEASILALIEHYTGKLPNLNERRERVVEDKGTEELRILSAFLSYVADEIYCD